MIQPSSRLTRLRLHGHARRAVRDGYALVPATDWELGHFSLACIQNAFEHLPADEYSGGRRERAHAMLCWDRGAGSLDRDRITTLYEQPREFNPTDGGKLRRFAPIVDELLIDPLVRELLMRDLLVAESTGEFAADEKVKVDLHAIRYRARLHAPAWSSPPWIHRDNEPLVMVHLINRDAHVVGGDNVIANSTDEHAWDYTDVVPLLAPLDTLMLANNVPHAVTPIGVTAEATEACRDVLLVTFNHIKDALD